MSAIENFSAGDMVRLASNCPIDFEGVGPSVHEVGKVVLPGSAAGRSDCLAVRFERSNVPWLIPSRYLEPMRATGRVRS